MRIHDPIPYDRLADLISDAGPSQQLVTLHRAWQGYAAKAARPYAWKTFALYARRQLMLSGDWSPSYGKTLTPWQDRARASPRVLVLGAYASLRVRGGALEIEHGPHEERRTIRIDIDAEPKPNTILFDSHGEFLTGEAIRWCARYSINLLLPGGPGRIITMVESALETNTNTMTRMRDMDPMIIRAQCAADPVTMAREIVRAKIEVGLKHTVKDADQRRHSVAEWQAKLDVARSVAEIMMVESHAAATYWRTFKDAGLRERKGGNLPRTWLRFANRRKGAQFLGPKHAAHPINAMLNYCYVVEAGRLAKALAAQGLALPIGYLHSDKKGRNSLVWDAIEPLRPAIDAKVFAFVEAHEFARSDFPQSGYNVHRLSRDVTQLLLHRASLPVQQIEEAAEWVVETIVRYAGGQPIRGSDLSSRAQSVHTKHQSRLLAG